MFIHSQDLVLIETLWNVKEETIPGCLRGQDRINRNIVECKDSSRAAKWHPATVVLIETLWNVKTEYSEVFTVGEIVLIETLWNVKTAFLLPG